VHFDRRIQMRREGGHVAERNLAALAVAHLGLYRDQDRRASPASGTSPVPSPSPCRSRSAQSPCRWCWCRTSPDTPPAP
jgi:hypothetical protein